MFNRNLYIVNATADSLTLKTQCPFCGKEYEFTLPFGKDTLQERIRIYEEGALMQEIFGDLSPSVREALKTGICDECWDNM